MNANNPRPVHHVLDRGEDIGCVDGRAQLGELRHEIPHASNASVVNVLHLDKVNDNAGSSRLVLELFNKLLDIVHAGKGKAAGRRREARRGRQDEKIDQVSGARSALVCSCMGRNQGSCKKRG